MDLLDIHRFASVSSSTSCLFKFLSCSRQAFQAAAGHSGSNFHHYPLILSPNNVQYLRPQ